jgi:hypothetical protein
VLVQTELPILAVADGADSPKLTPSMVRLVPPVVAMFDSRMAEITGASNENNFKSVPTIAAILILLLIELPVPPTEAHLIMVVVTHD